MEAARYPIILAVLALYMLLCVGLGIWAARRTRSTRDFFMASRSFGVLLTAAAVFSCTMSGFGFVGGPGLVYRMGMSSVWIVVTGGIGFVVSFALLAKRMRLLGELRDCVSLPDVAAARYGSESVRASVSVTILLGVLGYLATQILAMSVILQDILRESGLLPEITLLSCVALACGVLVFYSVSGGIVASVYTDLVQGGIMMAAALLVFLTVVFTFDGGLTEMNAAILEDDPEAMGPWGTLGMIGCLSWFFVFGLGSAGQPHVVTKIMMNRKVRDARRILPVSVLGYIVTGLLWIGIGLAMRALVVSGAHAPLDTPDAAAPQFLQQYAHPLLAGVVFAGIFAAIMSTADSFLNIGAAAVVHDLPKAVGRWTPKNELLRARVATVAITVFAAAFALYTGDIVAILGAFGWGTFAAALVPVVGIGLNWKRATPLAANVAVIASLLINFTVKTAGIALPHGIDVGALALAVSLVLFVSISLASPPPRIDADVQAVMDL